jgi:hypothetical protein
MKNEHEYAEIDRLKAAQNAATHQPAEPDFEKWLRTVCFQRPTPEAYDLARDAWQAARAAPITALTDERVIEAQAQAVEGFVDALRDGMVIRDEAFYRLADQVVAAIRKRALKGEGK